MKSRREYNTEYVRKQRAARRERAQQMYENRIDTSPSVGKNTFNEQDYVDYNKRILKCLYCDKTDDHHHPILDSSALFGFGGSLGRKSFPVSL